MRALHFLLVLGFFVICVSILVLTTTQTSPAFRYDGVRPSHRAPTAAPGTASPTAAPPTAATTAPTTASPTGAPTTASPTFAPLLITCPTDITKVLGSSLEVTFTGGSAAATGGCTTPVIQYADSIVGTGMPSIARSPSQPLSNLFLWATQSHASTPTGGASVSVSPTHVVWTTQAALPTQGAHVAVVNRTLPGTMISSFFLNTLSNLDSACSVPAQDVAQMGQGVVVWDAEANRWLAAQWANSTTALLCVYLSWGADPAGPYEGVSYAFPQRSSRFQLGVWGRTYALTLSEDAMPAAAEPLCVVDRDSFLVFNATADPNATVPGIFCDAPLNAVAHPAWGGWSPVHADAEPPVSTSSESAGAGTAGAVFLRPIDDEYQLGSMITPTTDYVEVEHWYNLNWTTQTHGTVRYRVSVADFSQRPGTGCGALCVPTPAGTLLGAQMGSLMPRPTYRRIYATGQESIVLVLTSHSNDVELARFYWFELRWLTPTNQLTEPQWLLYQQGVSPSGDGVHRFLPSACMDANGTIAIGYSVSSNSSVYPGLWATSRLGNDALGTLRDSIMLHEGALGSVISPVDPLWGPAWTMACDPGVGRWFYWSGAVSDLATIRVTHLDRLRVLGEIVERRWRADDYCGNSANCTQYITTV